MATIIGFIRTETGAPALNATVRAFDKDLRHEQLLGETIVRDTTGRFEIAYTAEQFRRAEKRTADLIVRLWDEEGNLRAESAVIFNAPDVVTINLTFGPSQTRGLSEFEQLVASLEPILEGVDPADLTDEDVTFLIGEARQPRQRVEFLQRSAQLNRETLIPTAAFYGWGRRNLPLELNLLLAEPFERLRRELIGARQQRIIPDLSAQFDFIAGRLDALQLETGRRTVHTFTGQLIDDSTLRPLPSFSVAASDPDSPPSASAIGQDVSDDRGFFSFPFTLAAANGDNPQQTSRRVELTISDSNETNVARVNVAATSNQQDVVVVRITLPPRVDETDAPIESIASSELANLMRESGFRTLNDLKTRDLSGIDVHNPEVRRLIGHARLSLLSSISTERDALLTAGFSNSVAIARTRRSDFVTATQAQLGDARAARLHVEARAHVSVLNNIAANTRVMAQLNPALTSDDLPISIPPPPCGCEDCRSAVSPGAYLTELADYAVRHLSRNGQELTLAGLEDIFHQPIGGLRLDCRSVDEQVRQARIAIEALRSFLQLPPPPPDGGGGIAPEPDPVFIRSQRQYLNSAYVNLLAQIGTSYDEVRRLPHANAETRQAAAERLGLAEENLDALFFDLNATQPIFFEDDLESRFGLRDTRRPPLQSTPVLSASAQPARLIRGVSPQEQVDPSSGVLIGAALTASPIYGVGTIDPIIFVFIPAMMDPSFCIPENPTPKALQLRAESNLYKLRHCLNIAGLRRELEPYAAPTDAVTGLPQIGAAGQLILPGLSVIPATAYRYAALIERTKELVSIAQQVESAFLSALEKRDQAAFTRLQARQNVEMSGARVQLQQLRVDQARKGIKLAELQRDRSQIQLDTYDEWISAGLNQHELSMLQAYEDIADFENNIARMKAVQQGIQAFLSSLASVQSSAAGAAALPAIGFAIGMELSNTESVNEARRQSQVSAAMASFERRLDEWKLSKSLATQDVLIGTQQIELAESQLQIAGQEFVISELEASHARETLEFLDHQFTNVELFTWMSDVLEGVYSYFLQQATSMAKLAENQLAFERQEPPPAIIQSDYWNITIEGGGFNDSAPDRKGLTGSARLLEDLYRLDQYAFNTNRRRLQLSKTFSLAQLYPEAFQRFRETGVMVFETPLQLFDRDFPGHYLRLIKQVRTSVAALIPPVQGIKATLSTTGASRVVAGGELFQTVVLNRGPESIALTSSLNATGMFELNPQPELLLPFEGIGVETTWEFRLPKPANFFNYDSIADVLITIDYTALDSNDYRQQLIQAWDPQISADRAFSFKQQFPDAWYDLHNPDQTALPLVVRFQTTSGDFPPNLDDLGIGHVVLYFSRRTGSSFEVPVDHLHFTPQGEADAVGGAATSIDGIISTRRGNASSWIELIGRTPIGEWELALPKTDEVRNRFRNEEIEEILLVVTYSGSTPPWPA